MSHLFEELEAKFSILDAKIEQKKVFVEKLYTDQQDLLNEHFDENSLSKKYSTGFNDWRQRLLEVIWANLRLEIDHVDEIVKANGESDIIQIILNELQGEETMTLLFICGLIRSEMACIMRLIAKEFKFGCKFKPLQVIKYKNILEISEHLVHKNDICDWDESLIKASRESTTSLETVRLLIDGGADAYGNAKYTWYNRTALTHACQNGRLEIVKYLFNNNPELSFRLICELLVKAIDYPHFEIVKYLVDYGADANVKDRRGYTAMISASMGNDLKMVKYLLENKAYVNDYDENYHAALIYSSEYGGLETVKYLVEIGAGKYSQDKNDALVLACGNSQLEMVEYLVEHGADANAADKKNKTALMFASERFDFEILDILVEHGANVNARDNKNKTALLLASEKGDFEIVKHLVENGANVNATDKQNRTALMFACKRDHLEIVQYLVENGADVDAEDKQNCTALEIA